MNTYKNNWESVNISSQKLESYFDFYQTELNPFLGRPITLLEIGVAEGGNLIALRKFLGREARIIGLDIREPENIKAFEEFDIEFIKGAWQDKEIFMNLISKIDVLIDDGPHDNKSMINSIIWGLNHLKPGGKIFIEDLHTNFMFQFGNPSRFSAVNLLSKVLEKMHKKTIGYSSSKIDRIRSIKFGPSICVIELNEKNQLGNPLIKSNMKIAKDQERMYGGLTKYKLLLLMSKYLIKFERVIIFRMARIVLSFFIYKVKDVKNFKYFFKL